MKSKLQAALEKLLVPRPEAKVDWKMKREDAPRGKRRAKSAWSLPKKG